MTLYIPQRIQDVIPDATPSNGAPDRSDVNMNPNSCTSKLMRSAFNIALPEMQLEIVREDAGGIYLQRWTKLSKKAAPDFTFVERKKGQGFCVGGYMGTALLERFNIWPGQKCLVEDKSSMAGGLLYVKLGSMRTDLSADRNLPIVSFDPGNSKKK